jgi:dTDP-4-amino-4,6-dideoxygalactose transaminase
MWMRKRLDIGWTDLLAGAWFVCLPGGRTAAQQKVEKEWSTNGGALACLSVRSGWDLLLGALALPPGGEIAMSALTIPDMARIAVHHGLTPVPVDLDLETAGPNLESLQRSITSATRAVLVDHLFGSRVRMEPIVAIAHAHGLLVIEDCAQAYDGGEYQGHPDSDVALFSFGPIKTVTALGGGVVRVRSPELLEKMRRRQSLYPIQPRMRFLFRLAKYALLKTLSSRVPFSALVRCASAAGFDYDRLVNGAVRGFPGTAFMAHIRQRPSGPLLALLRRRLRRFNRQRFDRRAALGRRLHRLLERHVFCPGAKAATHTHWVFPILAANPREVIAALRDAGFDATQGQSMAAVLPPVDRPEAAPFFTIDALAPMVFLPLYPEMPLSALETMADVVVRVCRRPAFLDIETRVLLIDDSISNAKTVLAEHQEPIADPAPRECFTR